MKTSRCIYCSLIKLGKHAPLPYVTCPRLLMSTLCRGVSSSSTMTLFQHGETSLALIRVIQSLSWAIMQTCFFNSFIKGTNYGLYSWKCIVNDDLVFLGKSFHIWYIASSRGPLPKLFKLCPWGQNWPRPGGHNFTLNYIRKTANDFFSWAANGNLTKLNRNGPYICGPYRNCSNGSDWLHK